MNTSVHSQWDRSSQLRKAAFKLMSLTKSPAAPTETLAECALSPMMESRERHRLRISEHDELRQLSDNITDVLSVLTNDLNKSRAMIHDEDDAEGPATTMSPRRVGCSASAVIDPAALAKIQQLHVINIAAQEENRELRMRLAGVELKLAEKESRILELEEALSAANLTIETLSKKQDTVVPNM